MTKKREDILKEINILIIKKKEIDVLLTKLRYKLYSLPIPAKKETVADISFLNDKEFGFDID